MSSVFAIQMLQWVLAAFFGLAFVINTFLVKVVNPDYLRWGYPDWFHFVSGALDLAVALLLLASTTRIYGVALGCAIMLVAIATVTYHCEYKRALPPLIVLGLLVTVGWAVWNWS